MGMRIGACIATGLLLVLPIGVTAELPKYEVVDLGALGDRGSSVFGMNSAGEVTGWSHTPDGQPHALLARRWQPMINLGTVPGGESSFGVAINDFGEVTGSSNINRGDAVVARAFRVRAGQPMIDLGTLGGANARGAAINDAGQIAGSAEDADGNFRPFIAARGGPLIALTPPAGLGGLVLAINGSGRVLGMHGSPEKFIRCFTAAVGTPSLDLGTLAGTSCIPRAINDAGVATGESSAADRHGHAFRAVPGQPMEDLGTLGGELSSGIAINNAGQVVGVSTNALRIRRAFIASPGQTMIDLGALLGPSSSSAVDINDAGQVTGSFDRPDSSHAYVWRAGEPVIDLGTVIDLGVGLGRVRAVQTHGFFINDAGQVAGPWFPEVDSEGFPVDSQRFRFPGDHGSFLATPISLLFSRLLRDVIGVGPGKSLAHKVRHARAYYEAQDGQATCAMLTGFSREVRVQRGKKVAAPLANQLIADARAIARAIECN
jgi:probable HAF family extracellular repeat protein